MNDKKLLCLICGGQSPEHEISLLSGWNIYQVIDRNKYKVKVIGITKEGTWKLFEGDDFLQNPGNPSTVCLSENGLSCFLYRNCSGVSLRILESGIEYPVDIAFPVLHGENGEDGTIQGFFQMLNLPYVGCDQKSSANCMDKAISKQLFIANDLPVARSFTLLRNEDYNAILSKILLELGLPLFVKPACTGSSIGVSKVKKEAELVAAIENAFKYDCKILVEEAIEGREIECAVLEQDNKLFCPRPGEIIPHDEFYSYEAKYLSETGASLKIPAELPEEQVAEVQELACKAFKVLDCRGMARVDFFLQKDGKWILNEINTIPGFTKISLYPQLMIKAGISYKELIEILISG